MQVWRFGHLHAAILSFLACNSNFTQADVRTVTRFNLTYISLEMAINPK